MSQNAASELGQYTLRVTAPRKVSDVAQAIQQNSPLPWVKALSEDEMLDALITSNNVAVGPGEDKRKVQFKPGQRIYVRPYIDDTYPRTGVVEKASAYWNQYTEHLGNAWQKLCDKPVKDDRMETLAHIAQDLTPKTGKVQLAKAKSLAKPKKAATVVVSLKSETSWPAPEAMAYLKDNPNLPQQYTVGDEDTSYGRLAYQLRGAFPDKSNFDVSQMLSAHFGPAEQGQTYNLNGFYKAVAKDNPAVKTAENLPSRYTLGTQDTSFVTLSKQLKPHFPDLKREQVQDLLEKHYGKPHPGVTLNLNDFYQHLLTGKIETPEHPQNGPQKPFIKADVYKMAKVALQQPGVNPQVITDKLLVALSFQESSFDPDKTSRAKAVGLTQFMPNTGPEYGLTVHATQDDRLDPQANMIATARKLSDLVEQNDGDMHVALQKYNGGNDNYMSAESLAYATNILTMIKEGVPDPANPVWVAQQKAQKAQTLAQAKPQPKPLPNHQAPLIVAKKDK